ncbi:MAG: hypothetical protein WDM89_22270 [Rhizomicrobium sp.]
MTTWNFPQNQSGTTSVTVQYTAGAYSAIAEIDNNLGRKLVYSSISAYPQTIGDGGSRTITAQTGLSPTQQDAMGNVTNFSYYPIVATSATHRPVPYKTLNLVTPPDPNSPAGTVEYFYDSEGRVNQVKDALRSTARARPTIFILPTARAGARRPAGTGLHGALRHLWPSIALHRRGRN